MASFRLTRRGAISLLGGQSALLSSASASADPNPQTAAEKSAGIIPKSNQYLELDPRRYGAIGDGVTDDTNALNRWVAVVNASTNPVSDWPSGQTYLCAPLNTITANDFTWKCYSTIFANAAAPANLPQVAISGVNARVLGLKINGNQSAFPNTPAQNLGLSLTGNNPVLENVGVTACTGWGLAIDGVTGGSMTNCEIIANAAFGVLFSGVSHFNVINCSFNDNGCGLHRSFATNQFIGFGSTVRFRSHHMTFVGCSAQRNGLDGFNTNQGSYAIKYLGCIAWMNDDGGFTIATDNTKSGRPGDGEATYDLEFIDCESYNNWSGGLSCESTTHNLTVLGGRYYNNNRLAGSLVQHPLFASGVYVAQFSQGFNIKTKCYDDRQLCPVSANSAGAISAIGWVAGTALNYPVVALYNPTLEFQGYARITAESSGVVTLSAAKQNGVTIARIAPGWFITQRVQHNGCYMDLTSTGTVEVDGFGFLPGVAAPYGHKIYANPGGNGINILNRSSSLSSPELLLNPSWDTSATVGWTYHGRGTAELNTTAGPNLHSLGCLRMASEGDEMTGVGGLIDASSSYLQDCWFEASCLVTCAVRGAASISARWNSTTVTHGGGGTKQLRIGGYLPVGENLTLVVSVRASATAFFDEASIKVKFESHDNRDFVYPARNLPS